MISKKQVKYLASLKQKKYRLLENKFIIEGKKLVDEALQSDYKIEQLICSHPFSVKEPDYINRLSEVSNVETSGVEILNTKDFERICETMSPQGIAAVVHIPRSKKAPVKENSYICLEDISDPGNMGTIIRTCDWFGFENILLSPGCAEVYNPKTIRAAMGSVFHLNIITPPDFYEFLSEEEKTGRKIFVSDLTGESIYKTNFTGLFAVVLCNEASGPSPQLLRIANQSITIPRYGNAESLNVAGAAAIIISSIRQKI